jgi:hypothetical protein
MENSDKNYGKNSKGFIKRLFGQLLLDGGFITERMLNEALENQTNTNKMLGEILVRMGALDPADLGAVLSISRNMVTVEECLNLSSGVRQSLGELFLQAKNITARHLDIALKEQQRTGEKLGRILIRFGFVTENELNAALRFQHNQGIQTPVPHCLRLGELLVATGRITHAQLENALDRQKTSGHRIGDILLEKGYITLNRLSRGLKLQQQLLTVVLISIFSMVSFSAARSAEDLAISGSLETHTALKIVFLTSDLVITPSDILRGYIDIPAAAQIEIQNFNLAGYLIVFKGLCGPFKEVQIEGLDREVIVTPQGGEIAQSYQGRDPLMAKLKYRFILSDKAKPGKYACPLTISVSPIIVV